MLRSQRLMLHRRRERHRSERTPWLRAAVLGANDGIVSTASIVIGVAAADASRGAVLTAGIAGLVAGAMSMAAGEFVSVSSQRDAERADLAREAYELERYPEAELAELAHIYETRGLSPALAQAVAHELSQGDRLAVHARDELGLTEVAAARPVQAAVTSASTFAAGAIVPILAALVPGSAGIVLTVVLSLVALGVLGGIGAALGGAPRGAGVRRVLVGGALAMAATALIGGLVGVSDL
jgi:VIT1/CCC1 family predicted Fe2+/Mn2+ transporter